jgi:hypothetical protein
MPPEPARIVEVRPWFTKATHDLRAAELLLTADRYLGDPGEPTPEEAGSAFQLAQEICDVLLSRLPAQLRP